MVSCPLCRCVKSQLYHQDDTRRIQRPYYQCEQCFLVFVPKPYFLSEREEKAEYDLHENHGQDEGYRRFLERFAMPFKEAMNAQFPTVRIEDMQLMDFGCGPGPVLAQMLRETGYQVTLYDAFYHANADALEADAYHAICATEVIEHLHEPRAVVELWLKCLKKGGVLGVMTKLVEDQAAFASWHYKNDPTHVCFFSQSTFHYLAKHYHMHYQQVAKDVAIFRKC